MLLNEKQQKLVEDNMGLVGTVIKENCYRRSFLPLNSRSETS